MFIFFLIFDLSIQGLPVKKANFVFLFFTKQNYRYAKNMYIKDIF
jgi:hypothetical protein